MRRPQPELADCIADEVLGLEIGEGDGVPGVNTDALVL